MSATRNPFATTFKIAFLGVFAGVISAGGVRAGSAADGSDRPNRRSTAAMLQSLEHDFDREGLEASVSYDAEAGSPEPGVRCASRPIADFEQQFIGSAVEEHLRAAGTTHRLKMLTIPVHFHILRKKGGGWNVADSQITAQLNVLNDSFAKHGFTFELDGVTRRKKNKFARKCLKESVEEKFKKRYAVDPSTTLNIYSCRPKEGVLGYASFPSDYPEDHFLHGVVLLHSTFPEGSAFPFDLGDTAVHEVGHYLGLYHTFQGRCGKKGDRVSDTPREKTPATGCEIGRDTCTNHEGLDPVTNYMDYSDDLCVEEFTPEQELRMKDRVATFRPSLGG